MNKALPKQRDLNLDSVKGVIILLISFNHLADLFPATRWCKIYSFRPIGLFSMTEALTFIAGLTLALSTNVCSSLGEIGGKVWARLIRLYSAHLFLAAVLVALATAYPKSSLSSHIEYATESAIVIFAEFAVLARNNRIFGIIETHIILCGVGFLVLAASRLGCSRYAIVGISFLLWLFSQFYSPKFGVFSVFNPLAWQFLFVLGLLHGVSSAGMPRLRPVLGWRGRLAISILSALAILGVALLRHAPSLRPMGFESLLIGRRNLPIGPLLNFLLVILALSSLKSLPFGQWPILRSIGFWFGRDPLIVFTWNAACHFIYVALVPLTGGVPGWVQLALLFIGIFGAMLPIAAKRRFLSNRRIHFLHGEHGISDEKRVS
jgi:hypothetical protein